MYRIYFKDILFNYQSPLTSIAVNPCAPYELAVGTWDSTVYVVDRRKLGVGNSPTATVHSVISKMTPGQSERQRQITSVEFSPDGGHVLASFSGDGVYLFDVKEPSSITKMNTSSSLAMEELFSAKQDCGSSARRRRNRNAQNFKRIRLRGTCVDPKFISL